ncbi:PHP domain-containing protein [Cystobacter fuscus]
MKPSWVWVGKGLRALVGPVLLLLGWAGFFTFAASYADYPVVPPASEGPRWPRGAFHVHTTRSDGRATEAEVAAAAKAAGLHFVVLTDHNDFTPREPVFVDGVLLVQGVEISTAAGHLVAFGLERPLEGGSRGRTGARPRRRWSGPGSECARPSGAGAQSVAPRGGRAAGRGLRAVFGGHVLPERGAPPLQPVAARGGRRLGQRVHGVMLLVEPDEGPVTKLLELAREKPRLALCAHDAHGLPGYEEVFQSLAMYLPPGEDGAAPVLPGDARAAAEAVVKGLASGRALCAFRALGEPEGFVLEGVDAERREAHVGDVLTVRLPPGAREHVRVEVRGSGRLRPDGVSVELVEEGAVQVEAWVDAPGRFFGSQWRPWIVPSPVRVLARSVGR